MSDETYEKLTKILLIISGLLIICNGICLYFACRSSSTADNNVRATMESIQAANGAARSELESGRRETERAEEHVERAADAVARSTEAARINAAGVDELQTLVSECRGIVKNQRELIREIEAANGIGTPEGKED